MFVWGQRSLDPENKKCQEDRGTPRKAGLEVGGQRQKSFASNGVFLEQSDPKAERSLNIVLLVRSDPQAKWSARSLRDTKR
jgi:hypothetical protein